MKKLNVIFFGLMTIFAVSTLTSCQAPKKKPRCLAMEESRDAQVDKPEEVKKSNVTT